ncbi:hypothetical protein SAMN06297358_3749 [Pedobacter xixiisoli]|uniref:Uncharacterized protein n=1 Tax=Pedobacter xixiisoli TaxID=1476464 RepID=A0A286ADQ6_9SPHI|nr:hypothetical protein SAMN06297358_3749 [Pedobacter xixiisoli]
MSDLRFVILSLLEETIIVAAIVIRKSKIVNYSIGNNCSNAIPLLPFNKINESFQFCV